MKTKSLVIGVGLAISTLTLSNVVLASLWHKSKSMATYQVTFVPTFTPATHPYKYRVGEPRPTHFSPLFGATFKKGHSLYKIGGKASPGLEKLAETGKSTMLMTESVAAEKNKMVYNTFISQGGNAGPKPKCVEIVFKASKHYPKVSIVAMIAPSPDWFMGVTTKLHKNGRWIRSKTIKAYAMDAGTDAGTDYISNNNDQRPQREIKIAKTKHFIHNGSPNPVGTFIFTQVPDNTKLGVMMCK